MISYPFSFLFLTKLLTKTTTPITIKNNKLEKSDIYASAQAKAEDITRQAMREAEETMRDADQYVADTLGSLQHELKRILSQVENGIKALEPKDGV